MQRTLDLSSVRSQYPALARMVGDRQAVFFDGPAGSQTPQCVADAVSDYLLRYNANEGGPFATSRESDAMIAKAREAFRDLFGADHPDEVVFGPNMTSLTFQLSRALARTWKPGDEIIVTQSDHDANVTPWVLAARDAGVTVHAIGIRPDTTLDLADFEHKLSERTRLVAFGAASNLSGTVHPIAKITAMARAKGALTYVDAVHYAPHRLMDVAAWGCDFAVCSVYKFFGPHLGVMFGRQELLEELEAYKVRPADNHGPEKWQTGTANFEGIAGALRAVDYLAELGAADASGGRRAALADAYAAICHHEEQLCATLLQGLQAMNNLEIIGLSDPTQFADRVATITFKHAQRNTKELAVALAERGAFAWAGHSYAVPIVEALALQPEHLLRVGILHYHDETDVTRFLSALDEALAS